MRSQATTCLFESSRRAEATVFRTRPSLKENNVDLSFYERLYDSLLLSDKPVYQLTYLYKENRMSSQTLRFLQQENQRLLEENRLLREEVLALRDYLAGLRSLERAAESITTEQDPLLLLDKILYAALTVVDCADGSIMLLDQEADELVFVVVRGELGHSLPGHRIPSDLGIAGWVATHKEPQIVNDVRNDQRFSPYVDETFQFETYSLLCVPMISQSRVMGVIEVLNKFNKQDFIEADLDLLSTLAYIAAIAIDRMEAEQSGPALQPTV
jgi:putative methionine-R-sulfoxide reductase with GAF domain